MASPRLSDLEKTAREIVHAAMLEGTLSHLTVRKVRDRIETMHGLEQGFLLAPQYKHSLKAVIQDASAQAKIEKKNEGTRVQTEQTMAHERDEDKGVNSTLTSKKQRDGKYKSAEFVENSSDLEELSENKSVEEVSQKKKSPKNQVKSKEPRASLKPPAKKRRKIVDSDNESTIQVPVKSESKTKDSAESDDEMATLFGDSPKSKKKAPTSGNKSRVKKATGNRKSTGEASDKHDATIKKLKSLVLACGVRKPWVKIFQDMPKPMQQIKKLREILTELGMTGRMSMEQAKRIRAERELAQELEDVKSFERSMLNRSRSQTGTTSSRPSVKPAESEENGDSEDEVDIKRRGRKIPASRNIDALIGSESDAD